MTSIVALHLADAFKMSVKTERRKRIIGNDNTLRDEHAKSYCCKNGNAKEF